MEKFYKKIPKFSTLFIIFISSIRLTKCYKFALHYDLQLVI